MLLKRMLGTCAALILCAAGSAFAFTEAEKNELLQSADYRENWERYQEFLERAKTVLTPEDLIIFEKRENEWLYGGAYDEAAKGAFADGYSKPVAYASMLEMHMDEAGMIFDNADIIRQSDGVSGLYLLKKGTLRGELQVSSAEEGEYAVRLMLSVDGEPMGFFEGSGKPDGKTLEATGDLLVEEYDSEKDSAAVTLKFDDTGVTAVTTEKFKRDSLEKKWMAEGIIFDGTYVRQKSVFMDAASD